MRDYSTISNPYPVFDRAGRDLAPQIFQALFDSSLPTVRRHLQNMAGYVFEVMALTVSTTPEPIESWLAMLNVAGNRVVVDKALKPWYAANRAEIEERCPFVAVDYLHFWAVCLAWDEDVADEQLGRISRAVLDRLPVPEGLDLLPRHRLWYAGRLRRVMLDALKRDLGRVRKVDFQKSLNGHGVGDLSLDKTITTL